MDLASVEQIDINRIRTYRARKGLWNAILRVSSEGRFTGSKTYARGYGSDACVSSRGDDEFGESGPDGSSFHAFDIIGCYLCHHLDNASGDQSATNI